MWYLNLWETHCRCVTSVKGCWVLFALNSGLKGFGTLLSGFLIWVVVFCYTLPGVETYRGLTRSHQSPGEQDWQFWGKWCGYKSGNHERSCGVCRGVALSACGVLLESNLLRGKELLWRNGKRFGTLNRLLVNSVLEQSAFHRVVLAQDSIVQKQSKRDALKFLWASYEHNRRQMCNHTEAMHFFCSERHPSSRHYKTARILFKWSNLQLF